MDAEPGGPPASGVDSHADSATILDGTCDPRTLGGKGAALDRLIRQGLPVPAAAVVPVAVYRRFVAQEEVDACIRSVLAGDEVPADEVDAAFDAGSFDPRDATVIGDVARHVGTGARLAVRSSATVEDMANMSFAGQYRSLLGVDADEPAEVQRAVKAVFASLWHPAPCAYRRAFGIDESTVAMAAVLMRMVPAERAGVTFTVDPGGAAGAARVETVSGLGESLVSGRETPDAAVLPRVGPRPGADPIETRALDLALTIEQEEGTPQDVEWAWDGEQVWIVQARPITVDVDARGDGFDDDTDLIDGLDLTTAGIGEMLPGVLPPLVWELSSFMVEEAFRRLLDDLGVLPGHLVERRGLIRRVRGRAAMDFSLMQEMVASLPGSADESLETEYFGSRRRGRPAAPDRRGPGGRLRSALHDLRVLRSRSRAATESGAMIHAIDAVVRDAPDPAALHPDALLAFHARVVDLGARAMAAELTTAADAVATHRRLQVLVARQLGEEAGGREAARLVARIGISADVPPSASAAVFAGPTWEELGRTPPPPPSHGAGRSPERERAEIEEFLDDLAAASGWKEDSILTALRRRAIRRLAHESTVRLAQRERTKAALLILGGLTRRIHLEIGGRLTSSGDLPDAGDVELLSPTELRASLIGGRPVPPDQLARRRRWLARYRQDGPLPARFSGRPEAVGVAELEGDRLEGWAASDGRFRGRVTVLDSPEGVLEPGAVLVAEATDPSWSPLFMKAGAIVLDRGGPLSHAAILARELGVPAVLNVPGASTLLAGRDVTVDGDAGVVVVHDELPGDPA